MPPAYFPTGLPRSGLASLLEAFDSAHDVAGDPREFAIRIRELLNLGVSKPALRWLIRKDYAEHLIESTLPIDEQRAFRPSRTVRLFKKSCFMLTDSGAAAVRAAYQSVKRTAPETQPGRTAKQRPADKPFWDAELRILYVGNLLVKRVPARAGDQVLIPEQFEAQGWPRGTDNPFTATATRTSLERLRAAVRYLNRHHEVRRIHFSLDGRTERVHWELTEPTSPAASR